MTTVKDKTTTLTLTSTKEEALASIIEGLYQGRPLIETGGIFTDLIKHATQAALAGEFDAHLADSKLEEPGNRKMVLAVKP
jgi:hypothetical protein